jgi:hypothetical protein
VLLSNGTQLDLSAAIDDSSDDVLQVTYTLHIPTGTQVVAYTPGLLGDKQVLSAIADESGSTYETATLVQTKTDGIQVTATTEAAGLVGLALDSVSGYDNQSLTVQVTI